MSQVKFLVMGRELRGGVRDTDKEYKLTLFLQPQVQHSTVNQGHCGITPVLSGGLEPSLEQERGQQGSEQDLGSYSTSISASAAHHTAVLS